MYVIVLVWVSVFLICVCSMFGGSYGVFGLVFILKWMWWFIVCFMMFRWLWYSVSFFFSGMVCWVLFLCR